MAKLTTKARAKMPAKEYAEPAKKAFPLNDKVHDRMAISGATRSANAGNISAAEASRIKTEARAKLNKGKGKPAAKSNGQANHGGVDFDSSMDQYHHPANKVTHTPDDR